MEQELKLCPFCNNTKAPTLGHISEHSAKTNFAPDNFSVCCWISKGGCGASCGTKRTPKDAVATWNRRTLSPNPVRDALREDLAALCHTQWSRWMEYLFGKCVTNVEPGCMILPRWAVDRWMLQTKTEYASLSESEKDSDRAEADRFLAALASAQLASTALWSKERPTEAGWYMVRGPGFRMCLEIVEIAGFVEPRAPHSWRTFDGCEWCGVPWPTQPLSDP